MEVFYETRLVGTIAHEQGQALFRYDKDWLAADNAFPISTAHPLSEPLIPGDRLIPWLANLLPEGDHLNQLAHIAGISEGDVLALVGRIGRETSGALSFKERGSAQRDWLPIETDTGLERIIEELPRKPFLIGEKGVSLSLAGAQTKMALSRDEDGKFYIPVNGSPSTHILKPDIKRLYGSVASEALCMTLARRSGLSAAEVTTGRAGKREYLVVTRYDRIVEQSRILRLHQEDFCQALGLFPAMKYQTNNTGRPGPSLADMAECLRRAADPASLIHFLDAVIFNVLACNPDSHAKNYSMFIRRDGASLAPLYDIMCASLWDGINMDMANKIGGKTDGAYLKGRHWQREATAWELNPTLTVRRVAALGKRVLSELDGATAEVAAMPSGEHPMLHKFADAIRTRCTAILEGLAE